MGYRATKTSDILALNRIHQEQVKKTAFVQTCGHGRQSLRSLSHTHTQTHMWQSQLPVSSPQIQGLVAQTGTSEPWLCAGIEFMPSTSCVLTGKGKSLPTEGKEDRGTETEKEQRLHLDTNGTNQSQVQQSPAPIVYAAVQSADGPCCSIQAPGMCQHSSIQKVLQSDCNPFWRFGLEKTCVVSCFFDIQPSSSTMHFAYALRGMASNHISSHYAALHYIRLDYITLHYITLHYIMLCYITLHYIHEIRLE